MRTKLRTPEEEQLAYHALTTADVAKRLGCTSAHVVRLITAGDEGRRLHAIDIGLGERPEYRVKPEWLEAFEARRAVGSEESSAA